MTANASERLPAGRLMRSLLRTVCVVLVAILLTAGIFFFSRYVSNRRLMALIHSENVRDANISIGWKGAHFDWLKRWIDGDTQLALFGRPVNLLLQVNDTVISNAKLLEVLRASSGLEEIFIHNRDLPEGCLEVIASQHCPRILQFRSPIIRAQDARWLSRMTTLKHVNVSQFAREERTNDWSWLASLTQLNKLEVTLWYANDADVVALAKCPASTTLTLSGPAMSDAAVSQLCDLPSLKHLDLEGRGLRLHFPDSKKFSDTLESFELCSPVCDDASLAAIAELPMLNRIWIREGSVSDAGLKTLATLHSLSQLWLSNLSKVTDDGMKELAVSTSLTEVHVNDCATTPLALFHLNGIPKWTDLRLNNVEFRRTPGADKLALTPENVTSYVESQRERNRMQREVINGPALFVPASD